jgi:hypothetical protein
MPSRNVKRADTLRAFGPIFTTEIVASVGSPEGFTPGFVSTLFMRRRTFERGLLLRREICGEGGLAEDATRRF